MVVGAGESTRPLFSPVLTVRAGSHSAFYVILRILIYCKTMRNLEEKDVSRGEYDQIRIFKKSACPHLRMTGWK